MLFWFITIAVTAVACAALFYAAGPRMVNAPLPELDDANSHFRPILSGIEADVASGKLGEAEASAARGELAREMLRLKTEAARTAPAGAALGQRPLLAGIGAVAVLALGLYALLGSPDMPSQPLAARTDMAPQGIDLETAIVRIETQLAANPDDLRGWTVIAPAYMEMGRYADGANAYRRVIALGGATPDLQTSLAEALLLTGDGKAGLDEALTLLRAAMAADPSHALSRLYLASALTEQGQYEEAIPLWQAALDLAGGDEPWLSGARQGLAVAQSGGVMGPSPDEAEMISGMVGGLADRLATQGGSVEEWMQLVRAYLVLGNSVSAQSAYDDAVAAWPRAFDRGGLDTLAFEGGLVLNGGGS